MEMSLPFLLYTSTTLLVVLLFRRSDNTSIFQHFPVPNAGRLGNDDRGAMGLLIALSMMNLFPNPDQSVYLMFRRISKALQSFRLGLERPRECETSTSTHPTRTFISNLQRSMVGHTRRIRLIIRSSLRKRSWSGRKVGTTVHRQLV